MTFSPIRKVYQGIADRRQMFRMFDRHAKRPNRGAANDGALYSGEWFEITEREHDFMLDMLPPLWMKAEMFAMCEFLTGSITSVFFTLRIDGHIRHFHGYCDLADTGSTKRMRAAIIERETLPVRAMTRQERLEHIWSSTADDYRDYAGERWPEADRGKRTVMFFARPGGTTLKLLEDMTDAEISTKLPVQFRHLPETVAA